ncbi:ABC transporter permease [Aeromicrobium fastidiosum]|uniref:ABC transporter permease n=1 Tax=Aeromicrobium fastidiosum TaxID=52699 RepID=A0A641AQW5_9ACTN|nr:ABC transporter permease [Aeromicrobium fastidiosum]KAA1379907.1 ABC transporter permease [Aeromicrobium fastidiosum]MBP2389413.1 peptide/nickel transport system permease protein [Aeromicrobium fastidiosum]
MTILDRGPALPLPDALSPPPRTRRRRKVMIATTVFGVVIAILLLVPLLPLADPLTQNLGQRQASPSGDHWLGQDALGRDVLSRIMWGARVSLLGMVVAVGIAAAIGLPWGLTAGYFGGWTDEILMRVADGVLAVPGVVLAIAIVGMLEPSLFNAMLAIGLVFSPTVARLIRSEALPLMNVDYVSASLLSGTSSWRAMWRHVFPNAMGPVIVQLCSLASLALIIEASLSFLGMATQPPAPSLGGDLADAYLQFSQAPLSTVTPGLAIAFVAFLVSRVGDELRGKLGIR